MNTLFAEMGRKMRAFRESLKLTQAQVSEKAGIETAFYGQIERATAIPSIKTLVSIAKALGIDSGDLLPRKSSKEPESYEKVTARLIQTIPRERRRLALSMFSDLAIRLRG